MIIANVHIGKYFYRSIMASKLQLQEYIDCLKHTFPAKDITITLKKYKEK